MLFVLLLQTSISAVLIGTFSINQSRLSSERELRDGWGRLRWQIENLKHQLFIDINLLTVYFTETVHDYLIYTDIQRALDYFLEKTQADTILFRTGTDNPVIRGGSDVFSESFLEYLGIGDSDFQFPRNVFYVSQKTEGPPRLYLITGTTIHLPENRRVQVFFINCIDSAFLSQIRTNTGTDIAFFQGSRFIASSTAGFSIEGPANFEISKLMVGNTPYKILPGVLSADIEEDLYMVAIESVNQERLYIRTLQTAFSVAFVIAFAAAFIMTALLTTYFISPFQRLNLWLRKYRETGVAEELTLHTKDEIGFLADTFYYIVKKIIEEEKIIREQWEELLMAEKISSLGILSAGMAHEINNPLGSILSHVNYLTAVEKDPEKLDSLEWIGKETNRIADIISRLLAYSKGRTETGRTCSLNKIIDETLGLLKHEFDRNNITVIQDLLPDSSCVGIREDEAKQVILNLALNSLQALNKKGTLEFRTVLDNGFIRLTVRDTGKGIPETNLSRVFDPFFSTKREGVATGFGLSISFKLVSNAGGTMSISSVENQGTTVEVCLPCT